jgi:pimeloyl-ACP methyl ester carboxylesterase
MLGYYRAVLEDIRQNAALAARRLSVPVLALGGDAGSAPDLGERLLPLCTDLRGGVVKDCGHYIPEEQPEALAEEVVAFIGTLEPRA